MSALEQLLYPTKPLQPQKRTKPMQVLALGLSRSGTDSLRAALEILGYENVYHGFSVGVDNGAEVRKAWTEFGRRKWGPSKDARPITREDFERVIGHCEAVTDQPCACFALELIEAYPEAKVILNHRDVDSWYESIKSTFGVLYRQWTFRWLSFFSSALYWKRLVFMLYDRGYYQGSMIRNGKRIHKEHYAMIRGAVEGERMLEWKVQDGWTPLCEFLQKPVPAVDFPNGNTPEQMRQRVAKTVNAENRAAYTNMIATVAVLVGVGIGMHRISKRA